MKGYHNRKYFHSPNMIEGPMRTHFFPDLVTLNPTWKQNIRKQLQLTNNYNVLFWSSYKKYLYQLYYQSVFYTYFILNKSIPKMCFAWVKKDTMNSKRMISWATITIVRYTPRLSLRNWEQRGASMAKKKNDVPILNGLYLWLVTEQTCISIMFLPQ